MIIIVEYDLENMTITAQKSDPGLTSSENIDGLGYPKWKRRTYRAAIWILGVAITPLATSLSPFLHAIDGGKNPNMDQLFGQGDLLIVGVVITTAGFVEIGLSFKAIRLRYLQSAMLLIIAGVLVMIVQVMWFSDITATDTLISRNPDSQSSAAAAAHISSLNNGNIRPLHTMQLKPTLMRTPPR